MSNRTGFKKRLLAGLLVVCLSIGNVLPAFASSSGVSGLEFATQVESTVEETDSGEEETPKSEIQNTIREDSINSSDKPLSETVDWAKSSDGDMIQTDPYDKFYLNEEEEPDPSKEYLLSPSKLELLEKMADPNSGMTTEEIVSGLEEISAEVVEGGVNTFATSSYTFADSAGIGSAISAAGIDITEYDRIKGCIITDKVIVPGTATTSNNCKVLVYDDLLVIVLTDGNAAIKDGDALFMHMQGLEYIRFLPTMSSSYLDFSQWTEGNSTFMGCQSLGEFFVDAAGNELMDCSKLAIITGMFTDCWELTKIPASLKFNQITEMSGAFKNTSITEADISGFKGTGFSTFAGCRLLTKVTLDNCVLTNCKNMFSSCWSLKELKIPSTATKIPEGFAANCPNLVKIDANAVTNIEIADALGKSTDPFGIPYKYTYEAALTPTYMSLVCGQTPTVADVFPLGINLQWGKSDSAGIMDTPAGNYTIPNVPLKIDDEKVTVTYEVMGDKDSIEVPVKVAPVFKSGSSWFDEDVVPRSAIASITITDAAANTVGAAHQMHVFTQTSDKKTAVLRQAAGQYSIVETTEYKTRDELIQMARNYGCTWSTVEPLYNPATGGLQFGSTSYHVTDQTFWPTVAYETRYVVFDNDKSSVYEIMWYEYGFVDQFPRKEGMALFDMTIYLNGSGRVMMNSDSAYMFNGFNNLTKFVGAEFIDTRNATSFAYLFNNCKKLASVDCGSWDTLKVTDMSNMFFNCNALSGLNIAYWATGRVQSMNQAFAGCSNLTSIDLHGWDFKACKNFSSMFESCGKAVSINGFQNSNLQNAETMDNMFKNCTRLQRMTFEGMTGGTKIKNISRMFQKCENITQVVLSYNFWSTIEKIEGLFDGCYALASISGVSNASGVYKITSLNEVFRNCQNLTTISVPANWFNAKVTSTRDMFAGCSNLKTVGTTVGQTMTALIDVSGMFANCAALTTNPIALISSSAPKDMSRVFMGCKSISGLNPASLNFSNATDISNAFNGCTQITTLSLSGETMSKVTSIRMAFANMSNLASITLPNSLGNVTDSDYALANNVKLGSLTLPATLKVIGKGFARNCTALTSITFNQAASTVVSFPTPGSKDGAFYVPNRVTTTKNYTNNNASAKAYKWADDNRPSADDLVLQDFSILANLSKVYVEPEDSTPEVEDYTVTYNWNYPDLPSGYTQLEYTQATGNSAIKTGCIGGGYAEMEVQFEIPPAETRYLMGWAGTAA